MRNPPRRVPFMGRTLHHTMPQILHLQFLASSTNVYGQEICSIMVAILSDTSRYYWNLNVIIEFITLVLADELTNYSIL